MPKIERSTSLPSTPRAQAVTRTSSTPELATPKGPVTDYAGQAAPPKELVPRGKPVSTSASPSALWGEAPAAKDLEPAEFAKLSEVDQRKTLQSLRAERNQLSAEIVQRLEKLDVKWNNSRLVTRTEALREYQENTRHLDPAAKKELDGLLERSEASQRKINELRAKIDRLPKTPEAKKAQAELRNQLAHELRRCRDEQSKVVKAATAVVDAKGLKTDRLATTEQIIDPSAPAQGSGDSLLDKIGRFFKLDWLISSFTSIAHHLVSDFSKSVEQQAERYAEEAKVKDGHRAEQKLEELKRDVTGVEDQAVVRARAALASFIAPGTAAGEPCFRRMNWLAGSRVKRWVVACASGQRTVTSSAPSQPPRPTCTVRSFCMPKWP